jgi:hypothetical protein
MKTFIEACVQKILLDSKDLTSSVIVIPNNRAALFLKKAFIEQCESAIILPKIVTISEFINDLAEMQVANKTELLFEFYNCYHQCGFDEEPQSFLEFYKWAKVVIADFNEIDNQLVNPSKILSHINEAYALEAWSPQGGELSAFQKKYIKLWANLKQLYFRFESILISKQKAYAGLIKKVALQRIESGIWELPYALNHLYFIGFSALSESEKAIIKNCILQKNAEIFWDTDEFYFQNRTLEAGIFLRKYKKDKVLGPTIHSSGSSLLNSAKNIRVLTCQDSIGQVEALSEILKKEKFENVAVVLCDENVIVPVLNSIPKNQKDINVTLGFPVNLTRVFSHWLSLIQFHCEPNKLEVRKLMHLTDNWIWRTIDNNGELKNVIKNSKQYFQHSIQLNKAVLQDFIDIKSSDTNGLLDNLIEISRQLLKISGKETEEDFENQIEKIFHQKLIVVLKQIKGLIHQYKVRLDYTEVLFIFKQLMKDEKIDVVGQPSQGIQIMGVLETRVLDFENIIMLSLNEGILPKGNSDSSIIPLDIKRAYKLPTYIEKDGIFAYHFYRLLQRTKNAELLYTTSGSALNQPEKSRFIEQISQELSKCNRQIQLSTLETNVELNIESMKELTSDYDKSAKYKELLSDFFQSGVSASAVNVYVACPKDFYHRYFLGLKELAAEENLVENSDFGTMVHMTLERLYRPYLNKVIDEEVLKIIKSKVNDVNAEVLKEYLNIQKTPTGRNYLVFDSINKYIHRFILWDMEECKKYRIRKILSVEQEYKHQFNVDGQLITIKGKIDRIEQVDDHLRVLDYKTGSIKFKTAMWNDFVSFESLEGNVALQLLFYYVLAKNHYPKYDHIVSGAISLKNISSGYKFEDFNLMDDIESRFINALRNMMKDLLDEDSSIQHKATARFCLAC